MSEYVDGYNTCAHNLLTKEDLSNCNILSAAMHRDYDWSLSYKQRSDLDWFTYSNSVLSRVCETKSHSHILTPTFIFSYERVAVDEDKLLLTESPTHKHTHTCVRACHF